MEHFGTTIRDRLRYALDEAGIAARALSEKAGLGQTAVRDILTGRAAAPRSDTLAALEVALGKPPGWLVAGTDGSAPPARQAPPPSEVRPAPEAPLPALHEMRRDVPVYGTARGADGEGAFVLETGNVVDWVRRPPGLVGSRDAYALWVEGDSMSPVVKHGALVYLHPRRPVDVGDHVVIVMHEGGEDQDQKLRAYVKEFVRRTATTLVTKQYNPEKEVSFDRSKIVSLHKVLTTADLMGV